VHDPAVYRRGTFHPTCKIEKLFLFLLALLSHRLLGKRKEIFSQKKAGKSLLNHLMLRKSKKLDDESQDFLFPPLLSPPPNQGLSQDVGVRIETQRKSIRVR